MKKIILPIFLLISMAANAQKGWQWIQQFGDKISTSSQGTPELSFDMGTDQWGNVYVAGRVTEQFMRDSTGTILVDSTTFLQKKYNYGGLDLWVAKYAPDGTPLWHKYAGGGANDSYSDMEVDANGNVFICGQLNKHNLTQPRGFDGSIIPNDSTGVFLTKLNSSGNVVWRRSFIGGYYNGSYYPFGSAYEDIILTSDGKIHVAFYGSSYNSTGQLQLFMGKDTIARSLHDAIFSANGNYLGYKTFPFSSAGFQYLPNDASFDIDNQGNYYLTTTFSQDTIITSFDTITHVGFNNLFLMSFTANMQERWRFVSTNTFDQTLGGFVSGDTVFVPIHFQSTNVGAVQFGAFSHTTGNQSNIEAALCLFNAQNGQVIGLYPNIGLYDSETNTWGVHANQHFMGLAGDFRKKMTFSGTTNYMNPNTASTAFSNRDNFFVAFDRQGNFVKEEFLSTFDGAYETITAMHFQDSVLYLTGSFQDTLRIPGVDTLIARGSGDIFVAKYDLSKTSTGIKNNGFIKAQNGLLVYPNPSTGVFHLVGKAANNQALVFDSKGQLLRTLNISQTTLTQEIRLEDLAQGLYFIQIIGPDTKQVLKIIKQ